jgi:hypothetical protein
MSLKNLERIVHRLEKKLPPLPTELFPLIDHLISQHPIFSVALPTRPFSAALHAIQLGHQCYIDQCYIDQSCIGQCFSSLSDNLLYDDDWSSIRQALDARWPRLRWVLASQDPLYQAEGYQDCLDALACAVWQKSTDPFAYYFTRRTSEQELVIYHQYRQLPSPQRSQYRHQALEDAAIYYNPPPTLLPLYLDLSAEARSKELKNVSFTGQNRTFSDP